MAKDVQSKSRVFEAHNVVTRCVCCEAPVRKERVVLGYTTCLECGEVEANIEIQRRLKCSAPAYNKGPYMYMGSKEEAKDAGKK